MQLLDKNMSALYRASTWGWSPTRKREELVLPGMCIARVMDSTAPGQLAGFCTYLIDDEDGDQVLYCYELQVAATARGLGLGRRLLQHMMSVARATPGVRFLMLTTFQANPSRGFFERCGLAIAPSSPDDADYLIMRCPITPTVAATHDTPGHSPAPQSQ
ncbi:uncharacterized protein MONBRDRAFT_29960 [Monosiga brevicollis MX1]|uniref:N-alpha-acetyltransferase 40 n=1 Tax=Monosiga brevicollis TaxID=81824 RepID=A9VCL6_MONBE|nr:uncharacterized protein MONBRDRAFT_29960 [Monosiga brevicollis MX1]EDQ84706.1 predicted protein [Monosiga brevicollis MX1]|eukprot:XP_001750492.1 hypothetical protein [Monosiga brevicollis MX1]